ncbi:hypothetical protein BGX28_000534, partial [Mortierella sp. GBA30]
ATSSDRAMGLFINTLPIRVDLDRDSVEESVRAVHARLAALLEHEHASLALAQRCSGIAVGAPLFSALLNYRHNSASSDDSEGTKGMTFLESQERTNYPFCLSVEDYGVSLGVTAQVVQPLEPHRICGYMQEALGSMTSALEDVPSMPVGKLEVLPVGERQMLLRDWNATQESYPDHHCLHHLFEIQVERTPKATALVDGNRSLTYEELNIRANRLAHHLTALGVQPDMPVAICVERSFAMIVGILAILKAGAAYVVDPNIMSRDPISNPQIPALNSRHLAYIIFTSGTTGTPKGVMIEHRGVVGYVMAQQQYMQIQSSSRMTQFFSIGFDGSVIEIFGTLCFGGRLHLLQYDVRLDLELLWRYLEQHRITHALLTPTVLQDCEKLSPLISMLILLVGGESFATSLARKLQKLVPNGAIINEYGPTEATVAATSWTYSEDSWPDITPIGRPLANKTIYLLDENRYTVPLGATGEIYIGGVGVARGYLNRPDLTANTFLPDPFSDNDGARMYRTGDLAKYLPDGNLIYLGRNDLQVKIRGFRIELGEIEAHLGDHISVSKAAVVTFGEGNSKRLIAYVVFKHIDHDELKSVTILRSHLATRLPEYMIPAAFVRLNEVPLASSGKLDRRALPIPGDEDFARQTFEPPKGQIEIALASIWSDLLCVERVGRHDNFFALGGHSLLAVRVMNRITTLGVNIPLSSLFSSSTLSAFAAVIGGNLTHGQDNMPNVVPVSRDRMLPLSFAQQRLWFLAQLEGVGDTYHIPVAVRLHGEFKITVWQQALDELYARHEALRSVFVNIDGLPQVKIRKANGVPLGYYDLHGATEIGMQLKYIAEKEAFSFFSLEQGPLIRAAVIHLADIEHILVITMHHIVSDGWSSGIMLSELSQLYTAYCKEEPSPLTPLAIQYPDYAAWQRQWLSGERIQTQSEYWRTALSDAPVLISLPTDRHRPSQQSFQGGLVPVTLDAQLTSALKQLSQKHGVTLFMTLLSAWSVVLSRLSGQDDIVIGTPSANRGRQEIEPLIGFFVNTLAMRIDLSREPNTKELLERVRRITLNAYAHQDLPFEQIVEIVQPPRRMDHTPLFQ